MLCLVVRHEVMASQVLTLINLTVPLREWRLSRCHLLRVWMFTIADIPDLVPEPLGASTREQHTG